MRIVTGPGRVGSERAGQELDPARARSSITLGGGALDPGEEASPAWCAEVAGCRRRRAFEGLLEGSNHPDSVLVLGEPLVGARLR